MSLETLIILHGWTFSHKRWQPLIKALRSWGYQVYYPILPGFGRKPLSKAWRLADYTFWLKDFVKKKKIGHYVLIAHSNGGRVALDLASQAPVGLEKLVLIASAAAASEPSLKRRLFWLLAKAGGMWFRLPLFKRGEAVAKKFLYKLAREQDYLSSPPMLAKTMVNLINSNLQPSLKKIRVPVLILWGGKDKTTSLKEGLFYKDNLFQAQLVLFPEATHTLPYQEPTTIAQEINRFVGQ